MSEKKTTSLRKVIPVIDSYQSGTSWYRIYADGWCEQGGRVSVGEVSAPVVTLLKTMKDTNYSAICAGNTKSTAADTETSTGAITQTSKSTITFSTHYINPNTQTMTWEVRGFLADGQY